MAKNTVEARLAKMSLSREGVAEMSQRERDVVRDTYGRMLAETDNPDTKKRIRRQLRRLGWYISKKGKPWINAKKSRKANANAKGGEPTRPTADEAIAGAEVA